MTVGERIKFLRKEIGLNQEQFGKKINVKQSTVGSWESGIRSVLDRPINDICRVFGVNYSWLKNGDGDMLTNNIDNINIAIQEKVESILYSENEFHINLIKSTVNFTDDELLMLQKLVNALATKKTD